MPHWFRSALAIRREVWGAYDRFTLDRCGFNDRGIDMLADLRTKQLDRAMLFRRFRRESGALALNPSRCLVGSAWAVSHAMLRPRSCLLLLATAGTPSKKGMLTFGGFMGHLPLVP